VAAGKSSEGRAFDSVAVHTRPFPFLILRLAGRRRGPYAQDERIRERRRVRPESVEGLRLAKCGARGEDFAMLGKGESCPGRTAATQWLDATRYRSS